MDVWILVYIDTRVCLRTYSNASFKPRQVEFKFWWHWKGKFVWSCCLHFVKTVGYFAITLYVPFIGILESHSDWCWCSKSNVGDKARVLSCNVLLSPAGTNLSTHHFPKTKQQLLISYPHHAESSTLLFNKRSWTYSTSLFLDLYWISLADNFTSSRIWCFLRQCGINTWVSYTGVSRL
jgi:hypothetical protein